MANPPTKTSSLHILLGFFLALSGLGLIQEAKSLGINYGQVGNNLPPPEKVLELLRSLKLSKARIYDTNPEILSAFANSNVELIVTVENGLLATLMDPNQALQWVQTRIKPYYPATKITEIAVGNEVYTGDDTTLISYLVPAMVSIHSALSRLSLDQSIKVSTPNNLAVLEESFPPSAGSFRPELAAVMPQFLQFLAATKAPFWINAYPYFAYKDSPSKIPIDYVLFNPNPGMVDPNTRLHYDNMLYAQVDAVVFAMARLGFGGSRNILRRQMRNEGTPLRPNARLEIYVFALFNEDMKPGPTSERNYGLFQPDGTIAYNVGLTSLSTTSSTSTSTSTSSSPASISLTSAATKVKMKGYSSMPYSVVIYLLGFQVFMRR
ncbi:hypothetical protein SASPL_124174 [Salvia splendens]|uniref:Glucan endo-1,3-beta-D-glucosidase n=1 Tax=Salvia splendens TaxID=180675 RepID=A0A8X8XN10_SALSN|nr:hypothetical protein SASPL_124174 [Salvia splendens]